MITISTPIVYGHPAEQLAYPAAAGRLEDQVPVLGHPLVGERLDGVAFESFGENSHERLVVGLFMKERPPGVASIQGVVDGSDLPEGAVSPADFASRSP